MPIAPSHLKLIYLSSTVTPAMGVGWVFSVTLPAPPLPARARPAVAPVVLRLAVVDC